MKKLNLKNLKVKSFVTEVDKQSKQTLLGAELANNSIKESPCGSAKVGECYYYKYETNTYCGLPGDCEGPAQVNTKVNGFMGETNGQFKCLVIVDVCKK